MIIKIVRQVNSRWHDGRSLSAMEGTIRTIDDDDVDAVAHARHIVAQGDAIDITDGDPATDETTDQAPEQDEETGTSGDGDPSGDEQPNAGDAGEQPPAAETGAAPVKKAAARVRKAAA